MLTVLGRRNSGNVQKVMWAIGELNLDYRREDIGGSFGYPDAYPNPNSVVPTICDGDVIVWESNACVRYLARTYGSTAPGSLWSTDPASLASADMWMEWQRGEVSAFFTLFQILVRGLASTADAIDRIQASCARCFGQLETQLTGRDYICGADLSMADIAIGSMMYRYMTLPIDRPSLPALEAWYSRLTQRPAYQKHVMIEYGTNLEEWNEREAASKGIQ